MYNVEMIARILLLFVIFWGCLQCGGDEGESGKLKVRISPLKPSVFLTDIVINSGTDFEKTIAAPWFKYFVQIENNASEDLFLLGINMKLSTSTNGQETEIELPGAGPQDFICGTEACSESIVSVPAGETVDLTEAIYVSGLPTDKGTFVFRIEATLEGHFGTDINTPSSNLRKKFNFTTSFSN